MDKIFCHTCGKQTNHNILKKERVGADPDDDFHWGQNHILARCAGCDAFTYAIETWSEDDWDPVTGEMDSNWKTYPRGATERQAMESEDELPPKIRAIYAEVIGAMNAQLPVLSAIGLRALIESICKDQKIVAHNLEKLIDGLASSGVLSQAQATILHSHRFLGNVAAHDITSAQPKELVAALEIAETIIRTIYVLPKLSKEIRTGRKVAKK